VEGEEGDLKLSLIRTNYGEIEETLRMSGLKRFGFLNKNKSGGSNFMSRVINSKDT